MTTSEELFREDGFVGDLHSIDAFFPRTVEGVKAYAKRAIESAERNLKIIVDIKLEDRNFKNTGLAFDEVQRRFWVARETLDLIHMTDPDAHMRDYARDKAVELRTFAVGAFASIPLYRAFKYYIERPSEVEESLTSEESYFLEKQMEDFDLLGLQLTDVDFREVQTIRKKLTELKSQFGRNIATAASSDKLPVSEQDLAGVSQKAISGLEVGKDGNRLVGVDYPTYKEVMAHCTVVSTRKALNTIYMNRAHPQNDVLLKEIVRLRSEFACKLGYGSFAELNLSNQMAKTPENVEGFLERLLEKLSKKAKEEHEVFTASLPAGVALDENGKIRSWDLAFVKADYDKKNFGIDDREIAEFFPLEHTLDRVFDIYQKFLGLKFSIVPEAYAWHDDVKLIKIDDQVTDKILGYLYLDLHPRPFKYSHACFIDIVPSVDRQDDGEVVSYPFVGVVIANFPKGNKDQPALLKHCDVTTFFHEFGHAMHALLGRTELAEFAGTCVLTDFVETPSQMFEEWMWQPDVLKFVSKHYETGMSLPDKFINSMTDLRTSDSAYWTQRQAVFSFLSLSCFGKLEIENLSEHYEEIVKKYVDLGSTNRDGHFHAAFGHLTSYAARYYSYLWAKVFALDLFDYVKTHGGVFDGSGQGARMVRELLGAGGSVKPDVLLKKVLGREPSQDAFLKIFSKIE